MKQSIRSRYPSLYKTFLTSFLFPQSENNSICSIVEDRPLWLILDSPRTMEDLSKLMEILQEIRDFCELPEGCFQNLIPIGDWGATWGSLCIDLSQPENEVDEKNHSTWSLVWFGHEDFDWDEDYLDEDGLLYGQRALLDFKTLLELYFYGALKDEFERQEGIRPNYEWYQDTLKR